MAVLEFDDELSRVVEAFNTSAGAVARRAAILQALAGKPGERILDVGSGPGHQVFELSAVVGRDGHVAGVDLAESAVAIARRRCADLGNVTFHVGEATKLPFDDGSLDRVMSSQVFEYLDDVPGAITEMLRVLKPGGRVLIHDTDWGALLWHSSDPDRMKKVMRAWDAHLTDPHLPQSLGTKLVSAGFTDIAVEPFVQLETDYDPASASGILMEFIEGYVQTEGISAEAAEAWSADLKVLGLSSDYFFSSNEYIFTGAKP